MTGELGKPVLVDNKAGAATTVASNFVAKAAPDGYTIYGGGTSLIINPTLTGNVQYDPHKSFDYVSLMSFTPFILQVNADFPAKTMAELIERRESQSRASSTSRARASAPPTISRPSCSRRRPGSSYTHRALSRRRPGRPGPRRRQRADDVLRLARGQAVPQFRQDARHRHLEPEALAGLPDIPTVAEIDRPADFEAVFWQGLVVPAGTPKPIVDRCRR